jgi:hypothetical protein
VWPCWPHGQGRGGVARTLARVGQLRRRSRYAPASVRSDRAAHPPPVAGCAAVRVVRVEGRHGTSVADPVRGDVAPELVRPECCLGCASWRHEDEALVQRPIRAALPCWPSPVRAARRRTKRRRAGGPLRCPWPQRTVHIRHARALAADGDARAAPSSPMRRTRPVSDVIDAVRILSPVPVPRPRPGVAEADARRAVANTAPVAPDFPRERRPGGGLERGTRAGSCAQAASLGAASVEGRTGSPLGGWQQIATAATLSAAGLSRTGLATRDLAYRPEKHSTGLVGT